MTSAKRFRAKIRREILLKAAAEIFFEQGYSATSIDAIIERTGGSKRNIYEEFGNKEGLFVALVTESADSALSILEMEAVETRDLQESLTRFGVRLMEVYMSPTLIGIYRTVVTEALRFPTLAGSFYEKGPGRATARLADVLRAAEAKGEIETKDCSLAASHFVSMIRDNLHLQVVLGLRAPPRNNEMIKVVVSSVNLFLNGIRPDGRKSSL